MARETSSTRILIAVAEPTSAELAALVCLAAGHQVNVVGTGYEALVLLDDRPFDLVLADLDLPALGGLGLTRLIRGSAAPYAGVPIVALAARRDAGRSSELREAGVDHVLGRPLRYATLRALLDRVLGPRRGRAA